MNWLDIVKLMIEKYYKGKEEQLMVGHPSPLYVSCWHQGASVTEYLLNASISRSKVQETGPDGLTPLMILFKLNKLEVIARNMEVFGCQEVLRISTILDCFEIFQRVVNKVKSPIDWVGCLDIALRANSLQIAQFSKSELERGNSSGPLEGIETPSLLIADKTAKKRKRETTDERKESFLTALSKKYPIFNEDTEEKAIFVQGESSKASSMISIEEDILSHVCDPFCPLLSTSAEGAANDATTGHGQTTRIRDLQLQPSFVCPSEAHQR